LKFRLSLTELYLMKEKRNKATRATRTK